MALTVPFGGTFAGATAAPIQPTPDIGANLHDLGGEMFKLGTALEQDRISRQLQGAKVQAMQGLTDLQQKYMQVGNPDQIGPGFDADAKALKEQIVTGLDPKAQADGGLMFDELAYTHQAALGQRAMGLIISQRRALADETIAATTRAATDADPQTFESYMAQAQTYLKGQVDLGVLTPEEAQAKASQMATDAQAAQLAKLIQDNPQAALSQIDAGSYTHLDPKTVVMLRGRALGAVDQVQAQAQRAVGAEIDNAISLTRQGLTYKDMPALLANPLAQQNPKIAELHDALAVQDAMPEFYRMTPAQMAEAIAAERKDPKTRASEGDLLKGEQAAYDAAVSGLSTDRFAYAAKTGIVGQVAPLPDPATTADGDLLAALQARATTAQQLRDKGYVPDVQFFSPAERDAWSKLADVGADPTQRARLAGLMASAFGRNTGSAAAELKADPVFALEGQGLASGALRQGIVQSVFEGQRILTNQDVKLPPVAARHEVYFKNASSLFDQMIGPNGQAIGANEDATREAVLSAADARFAYLVRGKVAAGTPIDMNNFQGLYMQALHEVMGGTGTYGSSSATGGVQTIAGQLTMVPAGIRGADIETALSNLTGSLAMAARQGDAGYSTYASRGPVRAATPDDLRAISVGGNLPQLGKDPLDAATMRRLYVYATEDGHYILRDGTAANGNAPVWGDDGQPYIIDAKKLLATFGPRP